MEDESRSGSGILRSVCRRHFTLRPAMNKCKNMNINSLFAWCNSQPSNNSLDIPLAAISVEMKKLLASQKPADAFLFKKKNKNTHFSLFSFFFLNFVFVIWLTGLRKNMCIRCLAHAARKVHAIFCRTPFISFCWFRFSTGLSITSEIYSNRLENVNNESEAIGVKQKNAI